MKKIVVFLNGKINHNHRFYKDYDFTDTIIICGDGGGNHLYKIDRDIVPHYIIGDLDSIKEDVLEYYKKKGTIIKKYPKDKDFTDGELGIKLALEKNGRVKVLGGLGGRLDHLLTNLNLFELYEDIVLEDEKEYIFSLKKIQDLGRWKGKTISIIPSSDLEGLTLDGFKYDVEDIDVKKGSSICNSNIIMNEKAVIKVRKGSGICIIQKELEE